MQREVNSNGRKQSVNSLHGIGRAKLAKELKKVTQQMRTFLELSKVLAKELYYVCPHNEIFSNGTFNDSALKQVKESAEPLIKDGPYASIIYYPADMVSEPVVLDMEDR